MDAGELVPDDIVDRRGAGGIAPGGPLGEGFVLDGFPRTLPQAEQFEVILDGRPLDIVVDLDVPLEIVLDRISGRRVCVNCQRVYHVNMPPTKPWICDTCGGRSCSATTTPRRRSSAGSRRTRTRRCRSSTTTASGERVTVVDGVGEGDHVFERLIEASRPSSSRSRRSP